MTSAFSLPDSVLPNPILPDPMQLRLHISPSVQQNAWQLSQAIPTPGSRWQAYLNHMSLHVFLDWLTSALHQSDMSQSDMSQSVSAWPSPAITPVSWALVNGSMITIGSTKLAIIPSEGIDQDGLEIPQEWVDIAGQAADYFLAIQLNPRESWLQCWGYTTHQHLKTSGSFDPMDRTYTIEADALTQHISALVMSLELCPHTLSQEQPIPLPVLSATQRAQLIQRLARPSVFFPRLSVPFSQWAVLMVNDQSWHKLCAQRLTNAQATLAPTAQAGESRTEDPSADPSADNAENPRIAWGEWLHSLQTNVQSLLQRQYPFSVSEMPYTGAVRSRPEQAPSQSPNLFQQLLSQQKKIQLGQSYILLTIQCEVDGEGLLDTHFELRPIGEESHLPHNLTIALVSNNGEILGAVQAHPQETKVQIKPRPFSIGERFLLVIAVASNEYIEAFEV